MVTRAADTVKLPGAAPFEPALASIPARLAGVSLVPLVHPRFNAWCDLLTLLLQYVCLPSPQHQSIHSPTKAPQPPCNRTPFNVQVAIPADALLGLIQLVVNINAYTPVPRAPPCVPPCLLHADC